MANNNITFIDYVTPVPATWLNFVNVRENSEFFATDFGIPVTTTSIAQGIGAVAAGTLKFPNNSYTGFSNTFAQNDVLFEANGYNMLVNMFALSGESIWETQKVFSYMSNDAHAGVSRSVVHIQNQPFGTGTIGPTNADFGLSMSLEKQNWPTTSQAGELDGMYIVVRNGGTNSDTTAILMDVENTGSGFTALFEGATTYSNSGTIQYQMDCQMGTINSRSGQIEQIGLVMTANIGFMTSALTMQSPTPSTAAWQDFVECFYGSIEVFRVDGTGSIWMNNTANNGGAFTIVNNTGAMQVHNANGVVTFQVDQFGDASAGTKFSAQQLISTGTATAQTSGICIGSTGASTATGGAVTPPATVAGYLIWYNGGTEIKIPYYNV